MGKGTLNIEKLRNIRIFGKIHYFDWAIFNSKLLVYQRVINPHKLVNHGKSTISMAMASIANCESLPEGNRGTGGEIIRTQLVGKNYVKTLRYRGFSGNDDLAGE